MLKTCGQVFIGLVNPVIVKVVRTVYRKAYFGVMFQNFPDSFGLHVELFLTSCCTYSSCPKYALSSITLRSFESLSPHAYHNLSISFQKFNQHISPIAHYPVRIMIHCVLPLPCRDYSSSVKVGEEATNKTIRTKTKKKTTTATKPDMNFGHGSNPTTAAAASRTQRNMLRRESVCARRHVHWLGPLLPFVRDSARSQTHVASVRHCGRLALSPSITVTPVPVGRWEGRQILLLQPNNCIQ